MSVFGWTPTDKQTDLIDEDENEVYNDPEQRSPWYGQQPTQGWYPMMTRAVPSYMPNYQMPTGGPAPPCPSPSPPVKRRPLKRHSKPCLHGYRGVALLILSMIAIMIGVIVFIIVLAGKGQGEPPETMEVQGNVKLDGKVYVEAYGNKKSPEYKHLASEFCGKMLTTLTKGELGEDAQLCRVDSFKNGSVDVVFTITIQELKARDSGMEPRKPDVLENVIKDNIVKESKKKGGLFDEYQKNPGSGTMGQSVIVSAKTKTTTTSTTTTTISTSTASAKTSTTTVTTSTKASSSPHATPTTTPTTTTSSTSTASAKPSTATVMTSIKAPSATQAPLSGNDVSTKSELSASREEPSTSSMSSSNEASSTTLAPPSTQTQPESTASVSVSTASASVKSPTTTVGISSSSELATTTAPPDEPTTTAPPEFCTNTTCENNGTCNNTDAGPVCTCLDGYSGARCGHMLTFCELDTPCQNGGTCIDKGEDNYLCVCPKCNCSEEAPFVNCTIDKTNICNGQHTDQFNMIPHPYDCKKFVNCTKDGGFVEESFVLDYEDGIHVFDPQTKASAVANTVPCAKQIDIKLCTDVTCANTGTCKDSMSGFKCTCTSGYKGLKCDEEFCTNTTCENNGTCNNTDAGPVCTCLDGYSGARCGHKLTFCELQTPCRNGGTCVDQREDKYVCVCPKCDCSQTQPFDNCTLDENNICTGQYAHAYNLIPHPYNCKMFVNCTKEGAFVEESFVWLHEDGNHVFDPHNEVSAFPKDVSCAKQIAIKLCVNVTCANGGTCKDTMSGFKCICVSGYKGPTCDEVVETCTPDTCENNGTCSNTSIGINCTCPSGYGGIHCENKIQNCNEVKCENGATCTDNTDTGYKCVCATGFTGVLCETALTFCQIEMPCEHGGTCVDLAQDEYVCVCPKCGCSNEMPFDNCTIDKANICKPENIKNNLVAHPYNCSKYIDCNGPNDTYVKEAYVDNYENGNVYDPDKGWSDANIKCAAPIVVQLCADVTCANGGTCEDKISGFKCHCKLGHYNGLMCEKELTSCDNVTCQHGTCENRENGFHCICPANYVGDLCQTVKIPCTGVTCLNGATCRDTETGVGHTCECVAGYTGDTCETDIDECASNPCHPDHSAPCEDKVNGYKCACHTCSCSNVTVKDDCTLDSLTSVKALVACKDARETHNGTAVYSIAHPYKCTKYIYCYTGGLNGDEKSCKTKVFNPAYTDPIAPCSDSVPECTQN